MGKVRINTIGDESLEKKQKAKAEKRKEAKSASVKTTVDKEVAKSQSDKVAEVTHGAKEPQETRETKEPRGTKGTKENTKSPDRSKKYKIVAKKVEKNKMYSLSEALKLLEETHLAKFDETVELHLNTHETGVTGTVTLPHGTGKLIRVAVLQPSKDEKAANDLLKDIAAGTLNFDVLIATPDAMPKLAKVARILGPRGLMPNPKNGTVTARPEEAAKKYAAGQFRKNRIQSTGYSSKGR